MADIVINAPDKLVIKNTDAFYSHLQCLQNPAGSGNPGILEISQSRVKVLNDISAYGGALMTAGNPSEDDGCGGGAILMGHAFTDTDDMPVIALTDAPSSRGGYDTLWLKQGDDTYELATQWQWGHLELGNLTAHGRIVADTKSVFQQTTETNTPTYVVHNAYRENNLWHNIDSSTRPVLIKLDDSGSFKVWSVQTAGDTDFQNTLNLDYLGNITITGNFLAAGTITAYGDLIASGKVSVASRNYIQWGNDTYLSNTNANVLQVNNGSGQLGNMDISGLFVSWINGTNGTKDAGTDIYSFGNIILGGWTGTQNVSKNIYPYVAGGSSCGTNTNYWNSVYSDYVMPGGSNRSIGLQTNHWGFIWVDYVRYDEDSQQFDTLDDLALVKNYTTKTVEYVKANGETIEMDVVDIASSLPHLLDENGMRSPARDVGFLLGCAKSLAKKQDEYGRILLEFFDQKEKMSKEIADLRSQVKKLSENGGVSA
jgi:hypothetical protein